MVIGQIAQGMKDSALSIALRAFLNDRFGDYGEVLECQLDTAAGRLLLKARLVGETEPVTACVERYELERDEESLYVIPRAFSSSREWLARLLTKLVAGKRYPVPVAVGALL